MQNPFEHTNETNMAETSPLLEHNSRRDASEDLMMCRLPCRKPVSMYCKSCEMLACAKCAEKEHSENRHNVETLQSVSSECEEALLKQADDLERKILPLQEALREITDTLADLDRNAESAKKIVNSSFDLLESVLSQRRRDLLMSIEAVCAAKRSKLTEQSSKAENCVRSMEDGLDAILLAMSPEQSQSIPDSLEDDDLDTKEYSSPSLPDLKSFLIYKQVSRTIADLCNYDFRSELGNAAHYSCHGDDHSSRANKCSSIASSAALDLTVPCENPHITVTNIESISNTRQTISDTGLVETSHAVAQNCLITGECITTGFCKPGEENVIVLTAKTWSGELETGGKVPISVQVTYVGPPDKSDLITYRLYRKDYSKSTSLRKTWDGSKLPVSLHSSRSSLSTPQKRSRRQSSKEPESPVSSDGRSPLKDFFPVRYEDEITQESNTELAANDENSPPSVTHRIDYIKNGVYEVTFKPAAPAKLKIAIFVYGKLIPGGSFLVTAINTKPSRLNGQRSVSETESMIPTRVRQKTPKQPEERHANSPRKIAEDDLVMKIGCKGRAKGQFSNPQGISVDHLGRLLVSDSTNQCLQVFSIDPNKQREHKFLFKFGERGRGNHQVQRPTGIYGLTSGDIAVSDYDNKVVKLYGENGKHKRNIGSGKLMGPKGVCLDQNGHMVVVDNKLCGIFVFQINGRLITKFGSHGTEPHQLAGPHFVAVNKENFFYVSDFYNHCVKVFSSRGDCLGVIGSSGEGCGQFNAPTGLAIDSKGNLIVADWGNSRLQVFDRHGSFLSYVNTNGDPLYGPQGVSLIQDGFVAVADSGNQCIKIYHYLQ